MNQDGRPLLEFPSVLNQLRLDGYLCDAVLRVQDAEFQVHKVILCEVTAYFRALFSRWTHPAQRVYTIPGVSAEMMELIIEFAYSSRVSVNENNVQDLMLAADQFNVVRIVDICSDFLQERLCPENCIGIWQFTKIIRSPKLQLNAHRFIVSHFEEVFSFEESLQLTVKELTSILGRDDLVVRSERNVYDGIMRWIAHKPAERERHIATLLSNVRMTLMSADDIKNIVQSRDLVRNNAECMAMVADATMVIRLIQENSLELRSHMPCVRPRLPNAILFATGGWRDGGPTNAIEAYDFQTGIWSRVPNQPERPRAYHGTAILDGYVYFVGGYDIMDYLNCVRKFDPVACKWHEVAPMHHHRCYVSVTVLNGCIYALGGYDGYTRLASAEYYQPQINQWSLLPPMHEQRSDAGCAALHGKVYICGGFNGDVYQRTAECYDPESHQWTVIAPMNSCRSGVGVVSYADQVFVVGGFDGNDRVQSGETYDPHTGVWSYIASMITPRSNFGIEVLDGLIFAVGGFNGAVTIDHVECYNPLVDEWFSTSEMEISRSALSCCVVSGLPNLSEYACCRDTLHLLRYEEDEEEEEKENEVGRPV